MSLKFPTLFDLFLIENFQLLFSKSLVEIIIPGFWESIQKMIGRKIVFPRGYLLDVA